MSTTSRAKQTERQRRYDKNPAPLKCAIVCDSAVGVHKEFRVDYHTDRGGTMRRNQSKPYANKAERRALKREKIAPLIKERDEAKRRKFIRHMMGYQKAVRDLQGIAVERFYEPVEPTPEQAELLSTVNALSQATRERLQAKVREVYGNPPPYDPEKLRRS